MEGEANALIRFKALIPEETFFTQFFNINFLRQVLVNMCTQ